MSATRLGLYGGPRFSLASGITIVTGQATGTALLSITEEDIVAGGKTIITTLNNDTWVTAGATFDAQRQNILDGLVSDKSEATGFNALRSTIPVTAVVRTSDTVVTITLPALPTYDITVDESLSIDIPADAIDVSATDVNLLESVDIAAINIGGSGNSSSAAKVRKAEAQQAAKKKRMIQEEDEFITAVIMMANM